MKECLSSVIGIEFPYLKKLFFTQKEKCVHLLIFFPMWPCAMKSPVWRSILWATHKTIMRRFIKRSSVRFSLDYEEGFSALVREIFAACMVELLPTTSVVLSISLFFLSKLTPVLMAFRNKKLPLWSPSNSLAKHLVFIKLSLYPT